MLSISMAQSSNHADVRSTVRLASSLWRSSAGTHHIALQGIPVRVAVPAPHCIRHHQAEGARLRRPAIRGLRWLLFRRAAGCWKVAVACTNEYHGSAARL